jgi:hypothetical protein
MSPADARHHEILKQAWQWEALERIVSRRARQLHKMRAYMDGMDACAIHALNNRWDQWEMRRLAAHPNEQSISEEAYRADRAAAYCASDPTTCGITDRCYNCHGCGE